MKPHDLRELQRRAEELHRDMTLPSVRAWKEETGGIAVGYLPIHIPRELLHAQGALPVGIMGGGEDVEIIRGDAFYQSYICHLPRSTIELALNGSLDCLDGMVFPATCDVIRNLSGIWQMQFPEKLSFYFDVPQDFSPEVGGRFYRDVLQDLSRRLVDQGAEPLRESALRESIAIFNESRRLVEDLYALRRERPWKIPTWELYLVMRAGLVLPVEAFIELLGRYRELVEAAEDRAPMDQARVVLTGAFCEQPPLGLLKTLERSGCYIVDDDLVQVHRWVRGPIATDGDPMEALVAAWLVSSVESPVRYIGEARKGEDLLRRVRESSAEGVLFSAPSFCDPALLDQPMTSSVVEKEGIPWTAFKYSENTGQFQVIREQAGTFADSIKLWSEA